MLRPAEAEWDSINALVRSHALGPLISASYGIRAGPLGELRFKGNMTLAQISDQLGSSWRPVALLACAFGCLRQRVMEPAQPGVGR